MKILLYKWGSFSEGTLEQALKRLGIEYDTFELECKDYHADSEFADGFLKKLHGSKCDAVITFDYFPIVSMLCEINIIPYYSWIYDCPMNTILSLTSKNKCNRIMCFDRNQAKLLNSYGIVNAIHFPLWADPGMMDYVSSAPMALRNRYACDISFIGNFYNGGNNRIRSAVMNGKFDDYSHGFIDAIVKSQRMIFAGNIIKESLTDDIVEKIVEACELTLDEKYIQDDLQKAAEAVGVEVSCCEREETIECIAKDYPINLYTSSTLEFDTGKLINKGFADNVKELPLIYNASKINLNMTSTNITSGIPLRVLDILSCGGFCLTNYRDEIAEYFIDGEDLVIYYDLNDLKEKIAFYLANDDIRQKIAENGHKKAIAEFNIDDRLKEMFSL